MSIFAKYDFLHGYLLAPEYASLIALGNEVLKPEGFRLWLGSRFPKCPPPSSIVSNGFKADVAFMVFCGFLMICLRMAVQMAMQHTLTRTFMASHPTYASSNHECHATASGIAASSKCVCLLRSGLYVSNSGHPSFVQVSINGLKPIPITAFPLVR